MIELIDFGKDYGEFTAGGGDRSLVSGIHLLPGATSLSVEGQQVDLARTVDGVEPQPLHDPGQPRVAAQHHAMAMDPAGVNKSVVVSPVISPR